MENFSFIQITDHHLLASEEQLRKGFSPGYALRMVMRHIAKNVAEKVDFIISTGDLVDPCTDETFQGVVKFLGINSSTALPGPQQVNIEGLQDFPMYFLPGNHDERDMFTRYLFPDSEPVDLYNITFNHNGVQFVFMDWGPETKAHLYPETREFLAQALGADLPSVIVCHQHVKKIGTRWLDDFLADNLDEFWDVVDKPGVRDKVLGILCGHAHVTYELEQSGIPILGLRSTAFPFAETDEPTILIASPHYRYVSIQNGVLTSRIYEVPL